MLVTVGNIQLWKFHFGQIMRSCQFLKASATACRAFKTTNRRSPLQQVPECAASRWRVTMRWLSVRGRAVRQGVYPEICAALLDKPTAAIMSPPTTGGCQILKSGHHH